MVPGATPTDSGRRPSHPHTGLPAVGPGLEGLPDVRGRPRAQGPVRWDGMASGGRKRGHTPHPRGSPRARNDGATNTQEVAAGGKPWRGESDKTGRRNVMGRRRPRGPGQAGPEGLEEEEEHGPQERPRDAHRPHAAECHLMGGGRGRGDGRPRGHGTSPPHPASPPSPRSRNRSVAPRVREGPVWLRTSLAEIGNRPD